ncbi:arf-GAP with Rho-GAP domain, ANK repeat and PH domain-containing protein 3-like isoform X2 [Oreochromis aureus]|uniref:arf-GAP with Rho-GAP domain, ANK repeat and PH domain-containing protein 3-like isoform X2 n=1 Tax=Oreochromis aureus TaxID=47969 RepID=UPI0019549BD0|nr:arf-GAP with Rho-GAP domain, ANK repeat and PH domain-containing protein 3-like isoform X2 [Oreochromis aureus]
MPVQIPDDSDFCSFREQCLSTEGWTSRYSKGGVTVWGREEDSSTVQKLKMRIVCKDVTAETLYDVLHDTSYRKKWDTNMIDTYDIGRLTVNADVGYYSSYKSEIMKVGLLRCREEPPKLLQGTRFQERTFQIRDHKLLLLKDKKSIKPEKEWALKSLKIYIGIRKKLKAPTRWGFTVMSDKHQLYLCCSSEAELWDWITSLLRAQNDDPGPPALRRHSSSDISKQKFGTMPLVSIRGDESNSSMLSANQTLRKLHDRRTLSMYFPMKVQQDSFEERSESPDLPEPLYEEVGDFGLQVLKSLETSFLSSSIAETQEVPDHFRRREQRTRVQQFGERNRKGEEEASSCFTAIYPSPEGSTDLPADIRAHPCVM